MPTALPSETIFKSTLFPLPADVVARYLKTYSTFSDPDMSFLVHSNNALADPADPVLHSLEFLEDPMLAHQSLELDLAMLAPWQRAGLPSGTSNAGAERMQPEAYAKEFAAMCLRSRIGTCIGAAILRGRMHQLANAGQPIQRLHADPGRHYLTLPEPANKQSFLHARLHPYHDQKTLDYITAFMGEGYFADAESAADVLALYDAWQESPACTMFSAAVTNERHFADICHAMMNFFRLQRIIEHEEKVAPRAENVYDPQKHFLPAAIDHETGKQTIDAALVDAEPWMEAYRRPMTGYATAGAAQAETPQAQFGVEHWGDGHVPRGAKLARVSRALARYVYFDETYPSRLLKVGVRASVEHFDLTNPDSAAVVAHGNNSFVDLRPGETLKHDGALRFFCGNDKVEALAELPPRLDDAESEAVIMALQPW